MRGLLVFVRAMILSLVPSMFFAWIIVSVFTITYTFWHVSIGIAMAIVVFYFIWK